MHPSQESAAPLVICLCDDLAPLDGVAGRHGVLLKMVDDVRALIETLGETPANGIVLDVTRVMRATPHEKRVLQDFIESFPVLRVRMPGSKGSSDLRALSCVDAFFGCQCKEFEARLVRGNFRLSLNLPLLVARQRDPQFQQAVRSCSMDVSEGGMFIMLSENFGSEQWVWLHLLDLPDDTPILAHVRWHRPWGAGLAVPGVGVKFARIKEEQHATLCRRFLLRESFSSPNIEDIRDALESLQLQGRE